MILTMLAAIFLNGFAILLAILCVMRLLYRLGICEAPRLAIDSVQRSPAPNAVDLSLPRETPDAKPSARAQANVAVWRSYLPADCVDTMIRMGWHETT